jgi:hypothetical protein
VPCPVRTTRRLTLAGHAASLPPHHEESVGKKGRLLLSVWENAAKCDCRTLIIAQCSNRVKKIFRMRSKFPLETFWPIRSRPVGRGRIGQNVATGQRTAPMDRKTESPRYVKGLTCGAGRERVDANG